MARSERGKVGWGLRVRDFIRQSIARFLDYNLGAYGSLKMILRSATSEDTEVGRKGITTGEESFISFRIFYRKSVLLL